MVDHNIVFFLRAIFCKINIFKKEVQNFNIVKGFWKMVNGQPSVNESNMSKYKEGSIKSVVKSYRQNFFKA